MISMEGSAHLEQVAENALVNVAGSRKTFTNRRWAEPGRFSRQHEDHSYGDDQFPFSYPTLHDPISDLAGVHASTRIAMTAGFVVFGISVVLYSVVVRRVVTAGAGLAALVALLACSLPALRAMRVDPLVALRHE